MYITQVIQLIAASCDFEWAIYPGAPNGNFRKISVRKTIWDLEFSEHLL